MTIDKNYNITYMNPTGALLAGKTLEQVLGTKCFDHFKTTHCNTEECCCKQAMAKDEILSSETIVDPKWLNMPVQYTGAPIKDTNGNITTIAGTAKHGFNGDGIPATTAQLDYPSEVAVDKDGNVIFTDMHSHRIRKFRPVRTDHRR